MDFIAIAVAASYAVVLAYILGSLQRQPARRTRLPLAYQSVRAAGTPSEEMRLELPA